jgi:hypothetical protein
VVIPYTFIGVNRFLEGGWSVFAGDAIVRNIALTSQMYSQYGFTLLANVGEQPVLLAVLKAGFLLTTMFEALSPLILLSRVFLGAWLVVMAMFHVSTLFAMNIFFWENLLLAIVVFGPGLLREAGTVREPA